MPVLVRQQALIFCFVQTVNDQVSAHPLGTGVTIIILD